MNILQSFKLALKSLATSKMRSLLTMLGIIIGVAAVIIIISLGDGVQAMMNEQFESLGTNTIQVSLLGRGSGSTRYADEDDMYKLYTDHQKYFSAYSPVVSVSGIVKAGTDSYMTSISGVNELYEKLGALTIEQGRFLQYIDVDRMQPVCIIGSYLNKEAFNYNGYGKMLTINGQQFEVIGVLEESAESTAYGSDNIIYIPYTNAMRLNGTNSIGQYNYALVDTSTSETVRGIIEAKLLRIYEDEDAYYVLSMAEMMDMMDTIMGTVMNVLTAIAAISLLVGGIGIMNIMLVSVTERTREIGIRKSLGAKGKDIRSQFVIEAATTSLLGGIIGIIVGVLLALLAGNVLGITAIPSLTAILVASGVSLIIGVLFGYLPANKAAKLNPIDALRYD